MKNGQTVTECTIENLAAANAFSNNKKYSDEFKMDILGGFLAVLMNDTNEEFRQDIIKFLENEK